MRYMCNIYIYTLNFLSRGGDFRSFFGQTSTIISRSQLLKNIQIKKLWLVNNQIIYTLQS